MTGEDWRPARGGLNLVSIGLLAWAAIELLWGALSTQAVAKLMSPGAAGDSWEIYGAALDRQAVVFPGFSCAAVVVVLIGCVGLIRTPGPGNAALLAVFALVGCALALLVDGADWVVRLVAERSDLMKSLDSKPIYMLSAIAAAITSVMLALAILTLGRRAAVPVPMPLVIMVLVLAGLTLAWSTFIILGRPQWRFRSDHPWLWLMIRITPLVARTVLLGVLAGIMAGRLPAPRPAP